MEHNISKFIQWYRDQQARNITYSMTSRLGPNSYDCSSAGYFALKHGGFLPADTPIGNTDSMFNDLERNGWTKVPANAQGNYDTKTGDVVIWGKRGASAGALGHFMAFVNANDVIHCNSYYNGIHVNNYDSLAEANGWPEATFYRYTGAAYAPPSIKGSPTDQVLEIGSTIKFTNTYTVNDVQQVGGIWQVRCNALCPKGFTWDDNGIPAEPLVEVDAEGYATADQDLTTAPKRFKIPGKYQVLDLGETDGVWLALISWNGLKFWVDVSTATEIAASSAGTPTPGKRPATTPKPPATTPSKPVETAPPTLPKETEPTPVEEKPKEPTTPIVAPPTTDPEPSKPSTQNSDSKEDKTMAFSEQGKKELNAATAAAQKAADAVAGDEAIKEIVGAIPKRVKMWIYFIGDALLWGGIATPMIVILLNHPDPAVFGATLSGLFTASGGFLLTMFGIYKNGTSK